LEANFTISSIRIEQSGATVVQQTNSHKISWPKTPSRPVVVKSPSLQPIVVRKGQVLVIVDENGAEQRRLLIQ
jgi:hypothetical protein